MGVYCSQGEENCREKSGGRSAGQMGRRVLRKGDVSLIIIVHFNFIILFYSHNSMQV